jgi:hypothetical protein
MRHPWPLGSRLRLLFLNVAANYHFISETSPTRYCTRLHTPAPATTRLRYISLQAARVSRTPPAATILHARPPTYTRRLPRERARRRVLRLADLTETTMANDEFFSSVEDLH